MMAKNHLPDISPNKGFASDIGPSNLPLTLVCIYSSADLTDWLFSSTVLIVVSWLKLQVPGTYKWRHAYDALPSSFYAILGNLVQTSLMLYTVRATTYSYSEYLPPTPSPQSSHTVFFERWLRYILLKVRRSSWTKRSLYKWISSRLEAMRFVKTFTQTPKPQCLLEIYTSNHSCYGLVTSWDRKQPFHVLEAFQNPFHHQFM